MQKIAKIRSAALTFDDVQIVPNFSKLKSRYDADPSSSFFKDFILEVPVVSASMSSITESDMAFAMCSTGAAAIVHRFLTIPDQIAIMKIIRRRLYQLGDLHPLPFETMWGACSFAVGVSDGEFDRARALADFGVKSITIDVAHGDSQAVIDMIGKCKERFDCAIIAGNIATGEAALRLAKVGADVVKVGIGCGSSCTTRIMTGCGVPQITAIMDVATALRKEKIASADLAEHGVFTGAHREIFKESNPYAGVRIIADGGIRYYGDVVKALAAGADTVMIGRMLAGTVEAPGELVRQGIKGDNIYKYYRGMASLDVQINEKNLEEAEILQEGVTVPVAFEGKLASEIVIKLGKAVQHGMAMVGAENIAHLRRQTFVTVTPNGALEALPRE